MTNGKQKAAKSAQSEGESGNLLLAKMSEEGMRNEERKLEADLNEAASGGRLSGGSGGSGAESEAFSSSEEDGGSQSDQLELELELGSESGEGCSASSPSSGRSTADLSDSFKQLNTTSNMVPETKEALALVEEVRVRFLDCLEANQRTIDAVDLEELRGAQLVDPSEQEQSLSFRWISRFLNFQSLLSKRDSDREREIGEAVEKLGELLQFRSNYRLNDIGLDHFCKEIYHLHGIFPFGLDRNNLPVLYLRSRVHRRWSHRLDEAFRRYVAWQVDLMSKSHRGARVLKSASGSALEKDGSFGIVFDCHNVSYSSLDMDFLKFLVKLLVQHYPTYCRYSLCLDLPWLFRSVWRLVRSWLPEEARNVVQIITARELTEFVPEDQIPNSVRWNDLPAERKSPKQRHRYPDDFDSLRGLDELASELGLSPAEVKQFRGHLDKVLREYQQLGAV